MTTEVTIDEQFDANVAKPIRRNGNLFISPFGVAMGRNISGQKRGGKALAKKNFVNSIRNIGVTRPVEVRKQQDGFYHLVTGNRRTAVLRHLIGTGEIAPDDPKAFMPIYEVNQIDGLKTIDQDDAANLIENSMREKISHTAKARAIDEKMRAGATLDELGLVIAGEHGKPLGREAVRQYRALLTLHPSVQDAVDDNTLTVPRAMGLLKMEHAEQLKALQLIKEAREGGKKKINATRDVIQKMKADKRRDPDGEPMYDAIRSGPDVRALFDKLTSISVWQAVPKASKLTPKGYEVLSKMCVDIHTWMLGGLTTKTGKPEDVALTLKTRLLALVKSLEA